MSLDEIRSKSLFTVPSSIAYEFITGFELPWEALSQLEAFITHLGSTLSKEEYYQPSEDVWVSKQARVAPSAIINAPAIICPLAEIRHCAFIRGSAIVGKGAVVGNSTELKGCVLFDKVQVPHYNYVGDSILGYGAHMGAGSITSNVKSNKTEVFIDTGCEKISTGRKKLGAILGDYAEIGCNAVLNPGTIVGRGAVVYPLSSVRGVVPKNHIYKSHNNIVIKN